MAMTEDHKELDARIAEYALGLLPSAERADLEARLASEPDLRALLAGWQERFAALASEVDPVPAPARVQAAIEARLFGATTAKRPFWQRLVSGSGIAGMATAVAVVVALFVALPDRAGDPVMVSELAAQEGYQVAMAASYHEDGRLTLVRQAGAAPEGRVLELWVIFDGEAPISLGVLPDAPRATLTVPQELAGRIAPGALLAITDEPLGGAPGGIPSGAVRSAGPLAEA